MTPEEIFADWNFTNLPGNKAKILNKNTESFLSLSVSLPIIGYLE